MKRSLILYISCFVVALFIAQPTHAQFLKKLKNKVEKSAEDAVLDKSGQKTRQKVNKGMDNTLDGNNKPKAKPAAVYEFDYIYNLEVSGKQIPGDKTYDLKYYLSPTESYVGTSIDQEGANVFMIIDMNTQTMHTFMKTSAGKMGTSTSIDPDDGDADYNSDYKITNLPNKTFLGYDCKGVKLENDEWEVTYYYVEDLPISMKDVFSANKNESIGANLPHQNGLMMYAKTIDKKKNGKRDMEMVCTKFKKTNYKFNTSGYTFW